MVGHGTRSPLFRTMSDVEFRGKMEAQVVGLLKALKEAYFEFRKDAITPESTHTFECSIETIVREFARFFLQWCLGTLESETTAAMSPTISYGDESYRRLPDKTRHSRILSNVEMRILRRDQHPLVMDRYLTGGTARSIPVVIALTEGMDELGWWGPRPRALQAWALEEKAKGRPKTELYPEIRRWYAKDKGETTIREVLAAMAGTPQVEGVPT